MTDQLSLALVYPPFGPPGLPSLGLSLLAAQFRAEGRHVMVDYWNLRVLGNIRRPTISERDSAYRELTNGNWFPFNEWIYRDIVYDMKRRENDISQLLKFMSNIESSLLADDILELQENASADVIATASVLEGFDIIGVASTFHQNIAALALLKTVKARQPHAVTIIGGANADGEMAQALVELHSFIDFAIAGEADETFRLLLKAIEEGTSPFVIPGVTGRNKNGVVQSGPTPKPFDRLDDLPVPDFDDYIVARVNAGLHEIHKLTVPLESSRGCWWGERSHCSFCGLNANGIAHRAKSFNRFIQEVETVCARYETPFFFMTDNILALNYFDKFHSWAKECDLKIEFFYEIKANLKRKHVAILAEAGITLVQPGIESFSTPILKLMRKGIREIQNVAYLKYAEDNGMRPAYNILCGFPGEDPNDAYRMIEKFKQLTHLYPPTSAPIVQFHRFSPYHSDPEMFALRLHPDPRYAFLYPFSENEISRIAYLFVSENAKNPVYMESLVTALSDWRMAYFQQNASLTHYPDKYGILIKEKRPNFQPRNILLIGLASIVYRMLDEPSSSRKVAEKLKNLSIDEKDTFEDYLALLSMRVDVEPIWFNLSMFLDDPENCMDLLCEANIVYAERTEGGNPLYLSLSTEPTPIRPMPDMERLGV